VGAVNWRTVCSLYAQPRVLGMLFLGFSAGLPYLLVFSTLSAWLRDEGVANTVIGFFSWVGVTYSIKVFWSPVVDRVPLPWLTRWLGKRRSWMLVAQLGIVGGLLAMANTDIAQHLAWCALFAVGVAFCSATQDIVIDAYRIEAVKLEFQGAMAAMYVLGYRLALLSAGAGAFYLAEFFSWPMAYRVMAAAMLVGLLATLRLSEPEHTTPPCPPKNETPRSVHRFLQTVSSAVIHPFTEFFTRTGGLAWSILLLVAVYKMSDVTMGVMANPFYLDLGFSKAEIAQVSKIFGFFMTIFGAALGGVMVMKYGILRPLLLGAVMVASTNLLFAWLAVNGPDLGLLAAVISVDNLSGGLAGSVFIAYLSSLTSREHTATQYALFTSLMTLPAQLLGGFSGIIVDTYGYLAFFVYSASVGLPAILLLIRLMRKMAKQPV